MAAEGDRSTTRRALAQLLVDAALADDSAGLPLGVTRIPSADVLGAADLHRLSPAVYRHLKAFASVSDDMLGPLAHRRHEQLMRHLRAVEDLKHAGAVLDAAGVAWVAVKGPVLAEKIWPSPDMRQYMDLDLVVDRRRFSDALAALQDSGVSQIDRNWPVLASTMRAELAMRGRFGTPLDLHWDIAVPRELRRAFTTDIAGMLARSGSTNLVGSVVRTLDPVDTVLHLVFHAAQAGANLLVWHADIRFAAAQPGFDWGAFERHARQVRFEVPAAMVIARVQRTLGFVTPPPPDVLRPAAGVWGRLAARRDARSPFPGLPGDPHLGGNMYSGARRRLLRTIWTSGRSHIAARCIEANLNRANAWERALYRDVPDQAARNRYLNITENSERP